MSNEQLYIHRWFKSNNEVYLKKPVYVLYQVNISKIVEIVLAYFRECPNKIYNMQRIARFQVHFYIA